MTTEEKETVVRIVKLSDYEVSTLRDARGTLHLLFGKLILRDNVNHVSNIIDGIDELLDALETSENSIVEIKEV